MYRIILLTFSILFLGLFQSTYAINIKSQDLLGAPPPNTASGELSPETVQDLQKFNTLLQESLKDPKIDSSTKQDLMKISTKIDEKIGTSTVLGNNNNTGYFAYILGSIIIVIIILWGIWVRLKWKSTQATTAKNPEDPNL